jgi:hypothetical protein
MKQFWYVAAVATMVSACAAPAQQAAVQPPQPAVTQPPAQQPAQPAWDPAGIYDFTTEVQGMAIRGVLTLRRGEQGLTGTVSTEVGGELPLSRVVMDGRRAEIRAATPQGDMVMRVEWVEDDRMAGGWDLGGMVSGTMAGQRRR